MLIYSTNILFLPLVLLLCSIDAYLLLASLRIVLSLVGDGSLGRGLQPLTDSLPDALSEWIRAKHRPVSSRVSWAVVIVGMLILRFSLASLMTFVSR